MGKGKHTEESVRIKLLTERVEEQEDSYNKLNDFCVNTFEKIANLCTCNNYNGMLNKTAKINEIAVDALNSLSQNKTELSNEINKKVS